MKSQSRDRGSCESVIRGKTPKRVSRHLRPVVVVSGEAGALPRNGGSVDRWTVGIEKPKRGPRQNAKARVAAVRQPVFRGTSPTRVPRQFANPCSAVVRQPVFRGTSPGLASRRFHFALPAPAPPPLLRLRRPRRRPRHGRDDVRECRVPSA